MWQYLGLQRSQAGYDALRLEIKRLEALFSHEKDLAFLVNTALRHAEAMHSSCGSHHVYEKHLSLK
jgi:hypothetical protein